MYRNLLLNVLFFLIIIGITKLNAQAQDDKLAKENWVLMSDSEKAGDYTAALPHLEWLLANAPTIDVGLYIKGAKIYEKLAEAEKDPAKKEEYQNKALDIYDARIKYFKDEANVLNRKGYKLFPYWQKKTDKYEEMLQVYKKIIDLNGDKTFNQNITFYMLLLCSQKKAGKLTDAQVLEEYDRIETIIDKNIAANVNGWADTKTYVEKQLEGCVTIDCNFVKDQMVPKFKANPTDINMVKKIYALLLNGKCTSDPDFFAVSEALCNLEPTYGRLKIHALLCKAKGDEAGYLSYLEKAANMATEPNDKAEIYLIFAQNDASKGNKSGARNWAFKVAATDPAQASKAYSFVGYLYLSSGGDCTDSNPVKARAVYIAAYNMFQKAGDGAGMQKAMAYFPSKEDVFTYSMGGQTVTLGCWIGETVTIPN